MAHRLGTSKSEAFRQAIHSTAENVQEQQSEVLLGLGVAMAADGLLINSLRQCPINPTVGEATGCRILPFDHKNLRCSPHSDTNLAEY